MMLAKFLFIEVTDRGLNGFLNELRSIFSGSGKSCDTNIHITLKGPQQTFNLEEKINRYKETHPCIKIGGAGRFNNHGHYVVYLKADCGDLKQYSLWRKPDYKGAYNPHISMYDGGNRIIADGVHQFLVEQNFEFKCTNYEFTEHTRKCPKLALEYHADHLSEWPSTSEYDEILANARDMMNKLVDSSDHVSGRLNSTTEGHIKSRHFDHRGGLSIGGFGRD